MADSKSRQGWRPIAAVTVAFALLLFGIHSTGASAGGTAAASKVATVGIANFAFHPPTLTIAKGGQVTFSNSSKVTHTATRGGTFDTGRIKPGKSVTVRFKRKGTFPYHCTIHPSMRGKIVVD
jgi:plastocyanin